MNCPEFLQKTHNRAVLALITANIIWGAASPIFKLALQNIPPFTLAFLRFYFSVILLLPFTFKRLQIEKKDILPLVLMSLSGVTVNITFFFFGLKNAPAINAPIIASAGPVFIYLLSVIFLKEKPHTKILTGLSVSLLGVLTIVLQPVFEHGVTGEIIGNLFLILATIGSVGHTIIGKRIISRYSCLTVTFWSFVIGTISFTPFFISELEMLNPLPALDLRGITGLLFGIFLSSTAGYTLYNWGLHRLEAQESGLFSYIDPIAAVALAIPLLGEQISFVYVLGSILVFSGIFIAEGRLHWHPVHLFKIRRYEDILI